MSSLERRYFSTSVIQLMPRLSIATPGLKIPSGHTIISFDFCTVNGRSWIEAPDATVFESSKHVAGTIITVLLSDLQKSSKRSFYNKIVVENLSSIGVPLHAQELAIEGIFDLAEEAVSQRPIMVGVVDVTVQLLDNSASLGVGDVTSPLCFHGRYIDDRQALYQRLEMEARYPDALKLIPATKASIEGLEKVRHDSLLEAVVGQMPCTICMEGLDHFDTAEEGTDDQHMLARLPCSHMYHNDCIVRWLEMNHVCPFCRTPIVQISEPSKGTVRLHWPMLIMSVVCALSATVIPRLFNRS